VVSNYISATINVSVPTKACYVANSASTISSHIILIHQFNPEITQVYIKGGSSVENNSTYNEIVSYPRISEQNSFHSTITNLGGTMLTRQVADCFRSELWMNGWRGHHKSGKYVVIRAIQDNVISCSIRIY
jgi:hypothetical protein